MKLWDLRRVHQILYEIFNFSRFWIKSIGWPDWPLYEIFNFQDFFGKVFTPPFKSPKIPMRGRGVVWISGIPKNMEKEGIKLSNAQLIHYRYSARIMLFRFFQRLWFLGCTFEKYVRHSHPEANVGLRIFDLNPVVDSFLQQILCTFL